MKQLIRFLPLGAALFVTACANEPKEPQKEIIIKEERVVERAPVVIKDTPKNGTTIVLDKKGVQVETKKVNVKIQPGN